MECCYMKKVCIPDCIAFQPKSKGNATFGCNCLDNDYEKVKALHIISEYYFVGVT